MGIKEPDKIDADPTNLSARRNREEAYEPNTCTNDQKAGKSCKSRTKKVSDDMGDDAEGNVQGVHDADVEKEAVESDPTAIGAYRDDFEK